MLIQQPPLPVARLGLEDQLHFVDGGALLLLGEEMGGAPVVAPATLPFGCICGLATSASVLSYLERDGVIVTRKRQWPDAGMYPVTRGGLILVRIM